MKFNFTLLLLVTFAAVALSIPPETPVLIHGPINNYLQASSPVTVQDKNPSDPKQIWSLNKVGENYTIVNSDPETSELLAITYKGTNSPFIMERYNPADKNQQFELIEGGGNGFRPSRAPNKDEYMLPNDQVVIAKQFPIPVLYWKFENLSESD